MKQKNMVFIQKKVFKKGSGITPEFIISVEKFVEKYKAVLMELAKK